MPPDFRAAIRWALVIGIGIGLVVAALGLGVGAWLAR
jgi:hypothetical protein